MSRSKFYFLTMIVQILSAALLSGCVAVETPLEESTPPAATVVESTAEDADQPASPTIAPPEATETPTPEPSATPAPSPTSIQPAASCPQVHPALPPGFLAPGTIVFNVLQDDYQGPHIQKFSTGMDSPQDLVFDLSCCTYLLDPDDKVSPDRRWLALENEQEMSSGQGTSYIEKLILYNGDENSARILPWERDWGSFTWLDAQRLLIYLSYEDFPPGTISLYEPLTGRKEQFFPVLPNLLERQQSWDWVPRYDPSFTRVLYLFYHWDVPLVIADDRAIALWDLESQTELWRRTLPEVEQYFEEAPPVWSPDGQQFALLVLEQGSTDRYELLLVSRDGRETKLSQPDIPDPIADGGGLSWSPDGRYLAFFVRKEGATRLLIYDLHTQDIWDPCFEEVPDEGILDRRLPVIWSPDSRQFLVNILAEGSDMELKYFLVVDVEKREIAPLGFRFWDAAWLAPVKE